MITGEGNSFEFVERLHGTFGLLNRLVWNSHRLGLSRDGEWPESEFFAALINQGFGGLDSKTREALSALDRGGPYRLRFECKRHNQQIMEPLTGADLGVVVTVLLNGKQTSRRGFLVQLKKASLTSTGKKRAVEFTDLHHFSGKAAFGRELHQAERMLLFSDAAVYWLAVPPGADSDKAFFDHYIESSSLAHHRANRPSPMIASHSSAQGAGVSPLTLFGWLPLIDHPEFDFFLHRYERWLGTSLPSSAKDIAAQYASQEGERLLRNLRADATAASQRLYGMRSRVPVLCAHAESVLALRSQNTKALSQVYDQSVPLTEFLLADVVANGFGDDDTDFLEAIMNNRPNSFIQEVVAEIAGRRDIPEQAPIASATLHVDLVVDAAVNGNRPQ